MRARKASICHSFSALSTEQVAYRRCLPERTTYQRELRAQAQQFRRLRRGFAIDAGIAERRQQFGARYALGVGPQPQRRRHVVFGQHEFDVGRLIGAQLHDQPVRMAGHDRDIVADRQGLATQGGAGSSIMPALAS